MLMERVVGKLAAGERRNDGHLAVVGELELLLRVGLVALVHREHARLLDLRELGEVLKVSDTRTVQTVQRITFCIPRKKALLPEFEGQIDVGDRLRPSRTAVPRNSMLYTERTVARGSTERESARSLTLPFCRAVYLSPILVERLKGSNKDQHWFS